MPNPKLKKLKDILNLVNEGLTRQEFTDQFERILKALKSHKEKLEQRIDNRTEESVRREKQELTRLQQEFEKAISKAKKDSDSTFTGIKKKMFEAINNYLIKSKIKQKVSEMDNKISEVDEKLSMIRDGVDGRDADEKKVIRRASKLALKAVKSKKLRITTIKGLKKQIRAFKKQIKELKEEIDRRPTRVGGGLSYMGLRQHMIDDEVPSGSIDGSNKDFELANTPNPANSVKVFVNGMRMKINEDYTLSGRIITFNTAPPAGSILLVDYMVI